MAADFFRLLVLVFRLLYCFSLLSFSVNFPCYFFCYFFLLFCIPLVYLWYSLIPSRVLSNHPLLSPSSPPISFQHLHLSLQLCPLPVLLSPSGTSISPCNSVPFRKLRPLPEPPPPSGTSASFRKLHPFRNLRLLWKLRLLRRTQPPPSSARRFPAEFIYLSLPPPQKKTHPANPMTCRVRLLFLQNFIDP